MLHQPIRRMNFAELQKFDFEFFAWPVDFKWSDSVISGDNSKGEYSGGESQRSKSVFTRIQLLPCEALEYFVAHTFGRPMAYPGSVKLLQHLMSSALLSGRSMLIEQNARRAKLLSKDGIEIDSMFLDRRGREENGNTLVICSEGNAGFYEVGCMGSPMKGGYSILAWNHPGFAGSSGVPYPKTVQNAIDVVVRYAVTELKFTINNTIFFAWSIGGFPASYAAMMYPDAKALMGKAFQEYRRAGILRPRYDVIRSSFLFFWVLDATFDDLIELGKARMPASVSGFVERVIKKYFNLNNSHQLINYPGPIRLIRRFREEIITTVPGNPRTNRGNFLLIQLLRFRYPKVMTNESIQAVFDYLSVMDSFSQEAFKASLDVNTDLCSDIIRGYFGGKRPSFPTDLGNEFDQDLKTKLAVYLTTMYMVDFDAAHCTPLPASYFRLPWDHEG